MKTRKPLRRRFLEKVLYATDGSGCWLWQAYIDASGYGRFNRGPGISPMAHRYAYEEFVGPIPDGLQLDHVKALGCRHRHCVNPLHLEPVTHTENVARGISFGAVNATKTHCVSGHEFTPENTITRPDRPGTRECRTCARATKAAYKRRNREKENAHWRRWNERRKAA